jgi:serine/threonine protein kinase
MGTVWLARDELLHRQVAVKEVLPPLEMTGSEREMLRERTLREARTAARLSHPNVVTIYDVVDDGDQPWIVMELVSARSLRDIVQQDGPLTPQRAAMVGLQVLAALRAAHDLGIVHRDVKPGNVLIERDGRTVLADFGIARAQDSSTITTSGVIVGSPSYIAPERAHGERGGPESDLWSLGATLYSAVEGRPPYDRAGALATLTAAVTQDPDPPRRCGPLWPVISGLLRRDPACRLGLADAELMLRGIAETDEIPETVALPASAGHASPGMTGTTGRLADAERTRAFHPHIPRPVTPLHPAEAVTPSHNPAGQALRPAPPADLPGATAAPSTSGPPAPAILPADSTTPHTGSVEPRTGIPEPGTESQGPAPEHPEVSGPPFVTAPPPTQQPSPAPAGISNLPAAPPSPTPSEDAPAAAEHEPVPGIADQPASAPEPREGRASRRRPRLRWVVTAVAALMAAAGALVAFNMPGGPAPRVPQRPAHVATPTPVSKSPSGPPPSSGASAAPSSRPGPGAQAAVPAGYHRYRDPTGFSIAVPDGWTVSHQGTYVYVTPPSGGSFLLIDQTSHPNPNPLADWRQQEANRIGTYPGYRRIRLQAINYPQAEKAADWEFTYYKNGILTHVLNRNILANSRHAYALYWSTPENEWNANFHVFEVFARTFQPAAP